MAVFGATRGTPRGRGPWERSDQRPDAARHWAPRGVPEPPRTRRVSKWSRQPLDRVQQQLEEWLADLKIGNTHDGD